MDIDIEELLNDYQRTAREAAATDPADQPWDATRLRGRVIDLLERGGHALAAIEGGEATPSSAITWSEADPPVVLARALAVAHRKLTAVARRGSDVTATMPDPGTPRSDANAA